MYDGSILYICKFHVDSLETVSEKKRKKNMDEIGREWTSRFIEQFFVEIPTIFLVLRSWSLPKYRNEHEHRKLH